MTGIREVRSECSQHRELGGSWFEETLPDSYWNSGSFWVTLRMWNIRVDAVELVLIPDEFLQSRSPRPMAGNLATGKCKKSSMDLYGDPGTNVRIELLKGGVLDSVIAASTQKSFRYGILQLAIPASQTAGTDYQVRVTSISNPAITDMSNNFFTITPSGSITVVEPNSKTYWCGGEHISHSVELFGICRSPVNIVLLKGGAQVEL